MRIYHVTINTIDYERRIVNQAESAVNAGHEVVILSLFSREKNVRLKHSGIDIFKIRTPFHRGGFLKFLHFNGKVFLHLVNKPVEILHCHDLWVLPAAALLSLIKKFHLIYDAHEFYSGLEIFTKRKIRKKIWMAVEFLSVRHMDALLTVSEPLAELYRIKYPRLRKVMVIRNLPKTEKILSKPLPDKSFPSTDDAVVIFQGHFRPGRGLINLMEAIPITQGIHLVMIGGGELEDRLKNIVRSKNLQNRVTFLGYLPTDALIQTTARADLGVVLFEPASLNYKYALPNKFFEYIMAGIPVLASDIQTFRDYIRQYNIGLTIDPSDIQAIASALMWMISDKEQLKAWRKNCLAASKELNWESEAVKMNQIYEDL